MANQTDTLNHFVQAFNQHDLNKLMACFSDDAVFVSAYGPPNGQVFSGPDEIRSYFSRFFHSTHNAHFGQESHYVSGDKGVSEWTLTGTMEAGAPVRVRGCDLFTFRGDKIVRKDTFLKQTG